MQRKKRNKNKLRKNSDDAFLDEVINTETKLKKEMGMGMMGALPLGCDQFEVLKMDRNYFHSKRELKQLFSQFGGNALVQPEQPEERGD